jgi:hypothetical protein
MKKKAQERKTLNWTGFLAPVKATIERESAGGRITEISQGSQRGQAAYKVKIAKEGRTN